MKNFYRICRKLHLVNKLNFTFLKPKKEEILIYREDGKKIIFELFKKNNIEVIDPGLKVNLFVLALTFFKCLKSEFFWVPYLQKYIEISEPKIFITRIANDLKFYLLKNHKIKNTKFISIQNGLNIGNHPLLINNINKKIKKNLSSDYIFCFNEAEKLTFEKVINGQCIITGSILNNQVEKKKFKREKNILFLSVFRSRKSKYFSTEYNEYFREVTYDEYFQLEKKLINFLIKYSKKHQFNLLICGTRESDYLSEKEKKFYQKLIGKKNWKYIQKTSRDSNYILSDQSEITVSIESCLGYESFARGNKVAFFSCRGSHLNIKNLDFKLDNVKFKNEGPFWTSKYNEQRFIEILDQLRLINDSEWKKYLENYRNNFFYYDTGNTIAKQYIN